MPTLAFPSNGFTVAHVWVCLVVFVLLWRRVDTPASGTCPVHAATLQQQAAAAMAGQQQHQAAGGAASCSSSSTCTLERMGQVRMGGC